MNGGESSGALPILAPNATIVWDYIHRGMPLGNEGTLAPNEVYALTAYLLALDKIIPHDQVLDQTNLPKVKMPIGTDWARVPDWKPGGQRLPGLSVLDAARVSKVRQTGFPNLGCGLLPRGWFDDIAKLPGMVLLAFVCCGASAAKADWEYTKWGMTPAAGGQRLEQPDEEPVTILRPDSDGQCQRTHCSLPAAGQDAVRGAVRVRSRRTDLPPSRLSSRTSPRRWTWTWTRI